MRDRFYGRESLHRRTDRQHIMVLRGLRIESLQRYTGDVDTRQGCDLGFLGGEDEFIHRLVRTVTGRHDHLHRTIHYSRFETQHLDRLRVLTLGGDDLRKLLCTHHQVHIIGRIVRIESQGSRVTLLRRVHIRDLIAYHLQVSQPRIGRCLFLEVQLIDFRRRVTRRGDADLVLTAIYYIRRFVRDRLLTFRISRHSLYLRHLVALHGYLIYRLRRRETRDRFAVHQDRLQRVILQQTDTELHGIGLFVFLTRRSDYEGRFAGRRRSLRLYHRLFLFRQRIEHFRRLGRTVW